MMNRLAPIFALGLVQCGTPSAAYYPPAKYDHPYAGKMVVIIADAQRTRSFCPQYGVACVIRTKNQKPGVCIVMFNSDYAAHKAQILRHEAGHCNGWSADHPDIRASTSP